MLQGWVHLGLGQSHHDSLGGCYQAGVRLTEFSLETFTSIILCVSVSVCVCVSVYVWYMPVCLCGVCVCV